MDTVNLLPSQPHLFTHFFRLAFSLLAAVVNANYRRAILGRRSHIEFDIDTETGFFPPRPLPRLPDVFSIWEQSLSEANDCLSLGTDEGPEATSKRIRGEDWRCKIMTWPVLDIEPLRHDRRLLQRAHLVLAWLVNFFVHSQPPTDSKGPIIVPKSLAVPLVTVSRCLDIAPVLTFADTVLWNCEPAQADEPLSMDNMRFLHLFSETEDERNFYVASAKAELRGVEMLRIIDDYNKMPSFTDLTSIAKVSRDVKKLAVIIDDINDIIQSVRSTCDPHVFYWDIRPWFEGSGARGPEEPKWIYEGVDHSDELDLSGPSAGQSSIMHSLDIFLDIDHNLRQKRYPVPSESNKKADHGFMERMRRYMPGPHREYLNHLAGTPRSVRELAERIPMLQEPYDAAVLALKRLRDQHMKIACLYIVTMSRSASARGACPVARMMDKIAAGGREPIRGTGGNELSTLLKAGRDATKRAALRRI